VLDLFAGSNTTGAAAEKAGRRWMAFDSSLEYMAASAFRFIGDPLSKEVSHLYQSLLDQPKKKIHLARPQEKLAFSVGV